MTKAGNWQMFNGNNGGTVGLGWVGDGLYDGTALGGDNQIHLTTAWSVNAGFEHLWNRQWQTSVYGGYTSISYDGGATNIINSHLPGAAGTVVCGVPVGGSIWPSITIPAGGGGNSCTPNFSFWQIGTRTQWNVSHEFSIGLDVNYTHLNTAYKGPGPYNNSVDFATSVADQDVWSGILRVQRSFYP